MHAHTRRGPDRLRRTGRAALLTAVALWVATQAVLSATLGDRWRDPLYADKADKLRQRIIAKTGPAGPPLTVVMFGSSRTANALRGLALEPGLEAATGRSAVLFNFGVPAAGPVSHLIHLRRLFAAGVRPDLVLI